MIFFKQIENVYKDDLFLPPTGRKVYQIASICLSEFFGTFFVMIFGCLRYVALIEDLGFRVEPIPEIMEVSLSWGLSYGGLYVCMAHISGLFLNPALTVTMVLIGEMSVYRMLLYIVCELSGALAGLNFILGTTGPLVRDDFCHVKPTVPLPLFNAFMYELIGTFVLAFVFIACHDPRTRNSYDFSPVKLGITLVGLHISLYKYTGCSLNPAKSLSTSIVSNDYGTLWVYLGGQFTGAILAPFFYFAFFNPTIVEPTEEAAEEA